MRTTMQKLGLYLSIYGVTLMLLWIGIFKFTPAEAKAIKPLVENSPFMFWMYRVLSTQGVSIVIGVFEIVTAVLLATFPFSKKLSFVGGLMGTVIFLSTLSFLFSTPDTFQVVDGIMISDFFIVKDIVLLGVSVHVAGLSYPSKS